MTISSTTRVAGPFTGTGTAATFPFSFKVFDATDLYVVTLDVATGVMAVLALTTDYTAALNEDQDSSPGGSITLASGNLASGYTLTVTTNIAELQGLDLTNGGGFYPDVVNAALDLLTILVQQLGGQVARSLQVPLVDGATTMTLPAAAARANTALGFDADGNLALAPLPWIGIVRETPAGAMPGRAFTLPNLPSGAMPVQVFYNGLLQSASAYSLTGTNLVLNFDTYEGDSLETVYIAA